MQVVDNTDKYVYSYNDIHTLAPTVIHKHTYTHSLPPSHTHACVQVILKHTYIHTLSPSHTHVSKSFTNTHCLSCPQVFGGQTITRASTAASNSFCSSMILERRSSVTRSSSSSLIRSFRGSRLWECGDINDCGYIRIHMLRIT